MHNFRRLAHLLAVACLVAAPAAAQVTVPFPTFVAGTVINPDEVNANFAKFTDALNRTGGAITGAITVAPGVTIDGIDLSAVLGGTGTPTFATIATTGLATLNSLAVTTSATVGTTLGVTGATTLATLGTSGLATLNSAAVTTTLGVTGAATFASTVGVSGNLAVGSVFLVTAATGSIITTSTAANAIDVGGGINAGTGNVNIIGTDGRIPAISSTQFANLSGANLTSIPETAITDGTLLARIAASETITGTWTFSPSAPTSFQSPTSQETVQMRGRVADSIATIGFFDSGASREGASITGTSASLNAGTLVLDTDTDMSLRADTITLTNGAGSGTTAIFANAIGVANKLTISAKSAGTGNVTGQGIEIQRNASGSGAAAYLALQLMGGIVSYVWTDNTGVARIATSNIQGPPQEDGTPSDTSGTVIGTQTSTRATKNIYSAFTDDEGALATLLQTPVWNFDYKSGAYNGQQFVGITTDDSPTFGMDLGRAFNPITAFGYTVAAFRALEARVRALEATR